MDVLVVGAGPTGLTVAAWLARAGHRVTVVDGARREGTHTRAVVLQPRTLEVLAPLGVVPGLLDQGLRATHARFYAAGRNILELAYDTLDTPYPFALCLPQSQTEAHLAAAAAAATFRYQQRLIRVKQDADSVHATLDDGTALRARWLVAADGAHSTTRHLLGRQQASDHTDVYWTADVTLGGAPDATALRTWLHDSGVLAIFPLTATTWRLVATAPAATAGQGAPAFREIDGVLRERAGQGMKLVALHHAARHAVSHTRATGAQEGRIFLAGDALMALGPAGGQGMNTGIQDAINLAWKLDLVLAGRADAALLDTYGPERMAVRRALGRGTETAARVARWRGVVPRALRDRAAALLGTWEPARERMARLTAELSLGYRTSPLVRDHHTSLFDARIGPRGTAESPDLPDWDAFRHGPHAGDRAPDGLGLDPQSDATLPVHTLAPGRHLLLLFDGHARTPEGYARLVDTAVQVRAAWHALVEVVCVTPHAEVPDALAGAGRVLCDPHGDIDHRYGAGAECAYLIRPDGHIAYRSQPIATADLLAYLGTWFVPATGRA